MGYNGFPRGIDSNKFPWNREGDFIKTKYAYVCHAEANAIFNSNKNTEKCKIYCTLFPCNECAKAIIQNHISEVIYESDKHHDLDPYKASRKLLSAAKIKCRKYTCKSV
jgi:dCMP deaminase